MNYFKDLLFCFRNELHLLVKKELDFWAKKVLAWFKQENSSTNERFILYQAKDKHEVELTWDGPVLDILAEGYNVAYGARSVKHEVERNVVSLLANTHQFHGFPRGAHLHLYVDFGNCADGTSRPQIRLRIKHKDSEEFKEFTSHLAD